ncbi:chaperonin 10-like protein [Chaetomium strumarium]|uniref:Chaperonin 10-like protein n=1 Tax=Chaetomium strumarium TaxID=1170767 RepID=A0AAJ0LYW1_9PEZI|nr:chaperonin 10-like protein [Chaetomium strumarium]
MPSLSFFRRMSLPSVGKPSSKSSANEQNAEERVSIPETQTVLLLHAPRQPYQLTTSYPVPQVKGIREVLVRTRAIGLNPIDWKAPDFNFGIPELPYISGRELAGEIVQTSDRSSRLKLGDRVLVISTDYRDLRKAAYQEYVVALDYNTVRIPPALSLEKASTLGVAFVAAALALGVCMGVDFSGELGGPDLHRLVREVASEGLASDIRKECLDGIREHERAVRGDWLAVWGGSSTSAHLTIQLAKLVGLKTVAIVDKAKHGVRLTNHQAIHTDLLVDSHDPQRAVDIIRSNLQGKLRFGIDTRGAESATSLLQALSPGTSARQSRPLVGAPRNASPPSPPATPDDSMLLSAHLIGLTGLPKHPAPEGTVYHTIPIKLFHEMPAIGEALSSWLERLLAEGRICAPEVLDVEQGLGSVNKGLDRMRRGEISGGKLVVKVA